MPAARTWALVHGLSQLVIDGMLPGQDPEMLARAVLTSTADERSGPAAFAVSGNRLSSTDSAGPPPTPAHAGPGTCAAGRRH